jgi:FkbM family methyltransferase
MRRHHILLALLGGLVVGVGATEIKNHNQLEAARLDAAPARKAGAGTERCPKRDPDWVRRSVAQQGEDLILLNIFEFLEIPKPTYIDIGAAHPVLFNNTYLLYKNLGARGVLVEPNPHYNDEIARFRPEDTSLNVGIGVTDRAEADYYVIRERPQLNTFSKEQADIQVKLAGPRAIEKVVKMPLVNINRVIEEHLDGRAPDLISLDVEGLDLAVLKSLDWERYRPAVLCVETMAFEKKGVDEEIVQFVEAQGYSVRGGTWVNSMFVANELLQER